MADYTYQELMKMQSDAIRRAEDMQSRARRTAGFSDKENEEKPPIPPQEPRRVKMPEGYLGTDKGSNQNNAQNKNSNFFENIKNSFSDINIDSDKALLLSLIMLLSEEKADELLIMALIYMLS